jgi:hypothetical protein
MTKKEVAKLIAKYERKLKRVRKECFEQGEAVGFKKASEIKHYCENCGKLLKVNQWKGDEKYG